MNYDLITKLAERLSRKYGSGSGCGEAITYHAARERTLAYLAGLWQLVESGPSDALFEKIRNGAFDRRNRASRAIWREVTGTDFAAANVAGYSDWLAARTAEEDADHAAKREAEALQWQSEMRRLVARMVADPMSSQRTGNDWANVATFLGLSASHRTVANLRRCRGVTYTPEGGIVQGHFPASAGQVAKQSVANLVGRIYEAAKAALACEPAL